MSALVGSSNGRDSPSGSVQGPFGRHGTHASEGPPGSRHAPSGPRLPTRSLARTHTRRVQTYTHTRIPILPVSYAKTIRMYREAEGGRSGRTRGAMAVLGLLPDSCTRPSPARPERVTRKDRDTGGTKKQCRQHNRRVSTKICPVQISTPTRLDKSSPLTALGLPGFQGRDDLLACTRSVRGTFRARFLSFFLCLMAWETNVIKPFGAFASTAKQSKN